MTASPVLAAAPRPRLDAVDLLRGIVMVLMALDHTRDFFSNFVGEPTNLAVTTPALFFTRWVTHFCAPVFVFLAGTGTYLSAARGKPRRELSRFLVTRGLWLVLLELTVVHFGWSFSADPTSAFVQVIWVIGVSMIALAALIHLPLRAVAVFGIVVCAGHNLLDGVRTDGHDAAGWIWALLHQSTFLRGGGFSLFVRYPLVPWVGVMAAGYAFGAILLRPEAERRRLVLGLGLGLCAAFVVLRASNLYGDPRPWESQPRGAAFTLMSFLNCEKYPPSLCYLLMTLGPALTALALLDRAATRPWAKPLLVFGRVPLFYYLVHVPLIHGSAVLVGLLVLGLGPAGAIVHKLTLAPQEWHRLGFELWVVYLAYAAILVALYPACRWFAAVKARNRSPWLSYL